MGLLQRKASVLAALILMILPISHAWAQLYKIVDESGNVTFSQHPPIEQTEALSIENVDVADSSLGNTAVTTKPGGQQYCGSISLPVSRTSQSGQEYFLRTVEEKRGFWETRLDSVEQDIENLSTEVFNLNKRSLSGSSDYQAQRTASIEKDKQERVSDAMDLRCAIRWAKKQETDTDSFVDTQSQEIQRLQGVHSKLISQRQTKCGEEPYLDPTSVAQTSRREDWQSCAKTFGSDISVVEKEIRSLRRSLGIYN